MNIQDVPTSAQLAESFLQRTAFGVLLLAAVYLLAAGMHLVGEPLERTLDLLQTGLALLAIVVVLPAFVRMLRLRMRGSADCADSDSYIGEMFHKACVTGFSVTFVMLMLTGPVSRKLPLHGLPVDFYIQAILAVSLGAFSATFFAALWRDRDSAVDDFGDGS